MLVNEAFRYELKPNNKQMGLFVKHCGVARFAWNWGLARRIELYKTKQGKERYTNAINQHRELNVLKKTDYLWMYEVSKCAAHEALRDLDRAYSNMFRMMKNHEKEIKKPVFKKKGGYGCFRISQMHSNLKTFNNAIKLPRIGWVRTKESTTKLKGRILNATVSREADRWYCSLCVEVNRPDPKPIQGEIVGIDLGIKCFATISNGDGISEIHSPKPLRKNIIKVKRLHRQLSRKQKGSQNRKKSQLKLARLHLRIKNTRKDFLAKETSKLAKTKSVICIEDLNIRGMLKNHHLARSVGDEGWGEFRRMLEYKTQWYGSRLIFIPRFEPSSKRCNNCGEINHELKLSDRKWICLNCGAVNERDPNSAHNIRDKGIEILTTESSSGSNACGVGVRPQQLEAVHDESGSKHIARQ